MRKLHEPVVEEVPRRKSSDIDRSVGRRVRLRRTLLGKTQAALAEQCFLSPQQVHKYELGESKMTSARLCQFARALGVSVSWFFDELDTKSSWPDDVLEVLSVPEHTQMLAAFSRLEDPRLKRMIIAMTKTLVDCQHSEEQQSLAPADRLSRKA